MKYEKLFLKDSYSFLGENGANPTLEIYLPYNMTEMNRENQKRPCIIICPGGGYSYCSQRESEPIAFRYLQAGYNVFLLTYSVGSANIHFPAQINEVAAVMDLINTKAEEWNCNTEKVAIIGFSAGGHLASHYSTAFDCEEVRKNFPNSKAVNATVLSYPVITADPKHHHKGSFENLLGRPLENNDIDKFSCDRLVNEKTPPAFIWHTADDTCVPVKNSILYATALSEHKIPFELHIFPFGGHGLSTCDKETLNNPNIIAEHNKIWIEQSIKWLNLTLNK